MFYILPSIGISAGGQFFVFFQMFFAYTSDISDVRGEDSKTKFTRFLIAEVRSHPDTQGSTPCLMSGLSLLRGGDRLLCGGRHVQRPGLHCGLHVRHRAHDRSQVTSKFQTIFRKMCLVGVVYAFLVMEPKLTKKLDNNNEKEEKTEFNVTTLLLNTFTVALKRRKGKHKSLLILAVISFTLFEAVFPVDDTLLFVHFKVLF